MQVWTDRQIVKRNIAFCVRFGTIIVQRVVAFTCCLGLKFVAANIKKPLLRFTVERAEVVGVKLHPKIYLKMIALGA